MIGGLLCCGTFGLYVSSSLSVVVVLVVCFSDLLNGHGDLLWLTHPICPHLFLALLALCLLSGTA